MRTFSVVMWSAASAACNRCPNQTCHMILLPVDVIREAANVCHDTSLGRMCSVDTEFAPVIKNRTCICVCLLVPRTHESSCAGLHVRSLLHSIARAPASCAHRKPPPPRSTREGLAADHHGKSTPLSSCTACRREERLVQVCLRRQRSLLTRLPAPTVTFAFARHDSVAVCLCLFPFQAHLQSSRHAACARRGTSASRSRQRSCASCQEFTHMRSHAPTRCGLLLVAARFEDPCQGIEKTRVDATSSEPAGFGDVHDSCHACECHKQAEATMTCFGDLVRVTYVIDSVILLMHHHNNLIHVSCY